MDLDKAERAAAKLILKEKLTVKEMYDTISPQLYAQMLLGDVNMSTVHRAAFMSGFRECFLAMTAISTLPESDAESVLDRWLSELQHGHKKNWKD